MKKTIFVTGGFGFVGLNFVRKILTETEYTMLLLVRSQNDPRTQHLFPDTYKNRIEYLECDLLSLKEHRARLSKITDVVHLAGDLGKAVEESFIPSIQSNVIGSSVLMEALTEIPIQHCIVVSSAAVYGEQETPRAITEDYRLKPINIYGASKLAAEQLAYAYFKTKKIPLTILRPFNIYGPYQKPPMLIANLIKKIISNEKITLNNGGEQTRDFIHVDDITAALHAVLESNNSVTTGQIYNLATGKIKTIRAVAEEILGELKADSKNLEILPAQQPESSWSRGSYKHIKKDLGWKPQMSFSKGLRETIQWYQNNHSFLTT